VDQERFEKLKQRATKVFSDLDALTGSDPIIRKRNRLSGRIDLQIIWLEMGGEWTPKDHPDYVYSTLDRLEEALDTAESFIAEVNRGPREV